MSLPSLSEIRKTVVAAAGVLAQVVALGVLHGSLLHYAQVVLAAATAVGVYGVRNTAPTAAPASDRGSADVGTLLLVAVFIVVLILLFHGRIN